MFHARALKILSRKWLNAALRIGCGTPPHGCGNIVYSLHGIFLLPNGLSETCLATDTPLDNLHFLLEA